MDANNHATYSHLGQPIQAAPSTSTPPQAPAPRAIRHIGTRYKENMIPFDNRGRATIHGAAATYVYANPSQAEVGVGQPQAYAANRASFLNLQQETSLAVSSPSRDYPHSNNCDNILPQDQRHPTSQYHPLFPSNNSYLYPDAMSLSYESRSFMPESSYPNMMHDPQEHEEIQHEQTRYPSPPPPLSDNPFTSSITTEALHALVHPPEPRDIRDISVRDIADTFERLRALDNDMDILNPGRSKALPKPKRAMPRDDNGRYLCSFAGCTEEIRDFGRKCEWNKHMDKHDRPYKCRADGCEKLPGFTYSGGLLRHEREVHGKHGGPKKQLNCPHPNCKRHTGKGFSRQENLNEHLRRVHTDGVPQDGEATEEEEESKLGQKRKRVTTTGGRDDVREELKRLRTENDDLRKNLEIQTEQTSKMMQQIAQLQQNQQQAQLQASLQQHARMPQASML